MAIELDAMSPGDVLSYWFDTGAMEAKLCYARVLKVGRRMLRVVDEHGREAWKYPAFFHAKVSPSAVAGMRAEGQP